MMVTLYADETGTHDPTGQERGSEVAGIAGYAAWREDWEAFCIEWQSTLNKYDVPRFHFKEYAAVNTWGPKKKGWPYAGWSEEKRTAFLSELAAVARKNTYFCVGGFVNLRDYRKIIPAWYFEKKGYPYELGIRAFFEAALTQVGKIWKRDGSKQIAFVFDQNRDPEWQASVFEWYRITRKKDVNGWMGSISFADSKTCLPLQAADMLAYRASQVTSKIMFTRNTVWKNAFDNELGLTDKYGQMSYCDVGTLRDWAKRIKRNKAAILKRWEQ